MARKPVVRYDFYKVRRMLANYMDDTIGRAGMTGLQVAIDEGNAADAEVFVNFIRQELKNLKQMLDDASIDQSNLESEFKQMLREVARIPR